MENQINMNSNLPTAGDAPAEETHSTRGQTGELPYTMQAALIRAYGPAHVLQVAEVKCPRPAPHEVLIRVRAAGVNPIDYRIRQGQLRLLLPARFPLILGYDVAGEIAAIGEDVLPGRFSIGDSVMSFLGNRHGGGYAQYATASADDVVRKPEALSMEEAAAIPLAASTGLQALRDIGKLEQGRRVLINGATGGVGHFAVQLAKTFGGHVTGVASASNHEFLRNLGADHVIDYEKTDFTSPNHGSYDLVFDVIANRSWWGCRPVLNAGGIYITTVPTARTLALRCLTWVGKKCRFVLAQPRRNDLETLRQSADRGELRPEVDEVFPLGQVARAHEVIQAHHVRGKLVLQID